MRGECRPFSLEDIKAYLLILKRKKLRVVRSLLDKHISSWKKKRSKAENGLSLALRALKRKVCT